MPARRSLDDLWTITLYDDDQAMTTHDSPVFDKPPGYRSYLLRFWEERSEQPAVSLWRFSLEDPRTAQRQSFANLEALIEWLQTETAHAQTSGSPE